MNSVKRKFTIRPIKSFECKDWLLYKHYAHRIPPISFAFGLYDSDLQGVCTFGVPASRFEFSVQPYELNRLIVNEGLPLNSLSYFVSQSLRQIVTNEIIVSYADENNGHHGYIYQATNWLYTGRSSAEKRMFINGVELHRKTLYNKYGTSSVKNLRDGKHVEYEQQLGKHRYFYFTGQHKRRLRQEVIAKFPIQPYPKGDNGRYDASHVPQTQGLLF